MDDLFQLLQEWAFEPEVAQAVCLGFVMACRELNASDKSPVIKSVIARRIVGHAKRGMHDADRLCRRVVEELLPRRRAG